jgi:hypothetical protein
MNCITVNPEGRVSQIYDCNPDMTVIHGFQIFTSTDKERLKRIQQNFRPMENTDALTPTVIAEMKHHRENENWGQLRDMIKRYLKTDACCSTAMDALLKGMW